MDNSMENTKWTNWTILSYIFHPPPPLIWWAFKIDNSYSILMFVCKTFCIKSRAFLEALDVFNFVTLQPRSQRKRFAS